MFTQYFKNLIMDNIFNGNPESAALPNEYYIGLSTTEPTQDGTNINEPVGNGYNRVKVESLSASNNGKVVNSNVVEFPQSSGSWGTVTHCVLFDGIGGDAKVVWYKELSSPQSVGEDNVLAFKPESLWFELIDKIV